MIKYEAWVAKIRYNAVTFQSWLAEKFHASVLAEVAASNAATSFLKWLCPKCSKSYKIVKRLGGHDKVQKRYCFYLFRPNGLFSDL